MFTHRRGRERGRGRWGGLGRRRRRQQTEGSLCLRTDWGVLMCGGRREMKTDSSGWREGLWCCEEKGMMEERRERNVERERGAVMEGRDGGRTGRREREAEILWGYRIHCTAADLWCLGQKHEGFSVRLNILLLFFFLLRESVGSWIEWHEWFIGVLEERGTDRGSQRRLCPMDYL